MMQNRKGFTLIELLAVIVILAIIALITTPTILKDKAYGTIKAVQLAYTQAQVSYEVNMPYTVDFSSKRDGASDGSTEKGFTYVEGQEVQASGEMPTAGQVLIDNDGQIYIKATESNYKSGLKFGNYYCYDLGANKNHEVACKR